VWKRVNASGQAVQGLPAQPGRHSPTVRPTRGAPHAGQQLLVCVHEQLDGLLPDLQRGHVGQEVVAAEEAHEDCGVGKGACGWVGASRQLCGCACGGCGLTTEQRGSRRSLVVPQPPFAVNSHAQRPAVWAPVLRPPARPPQSTPSPKSSNTRSRSKGKGVGTHRSFCRYSRSTPTSRNWYGFLATSCGGVGVKGDARWRW